jgi:hypothetical protein
MKRMSRWGRIGNDFSTLACTVVTAFGFSSNQSLAFSIGEAAWSDKQWMGHCSNVRTSINPHHALTNEALTLTLHDPRLVDFLY